MRAHSGRKSAIGRLHHYQSSATTQESGGNERYQSIASPNNRGILIRQVSSNCQSTFKVNACEEAGCAQTCSLKWHCQYAQSTQIPASPFSRNYCSLRQKLSGHPYSACSAGMRVPTISSAMREERDKLCGG